MSFAAIDEVMRFCVFTLRPSHHMSATLRATEVFILLSVLLSQPQIWITRLCLHPWRRYVKTTLLFCVDPICRTPLLPTAWWRVWGRFRSTDRPCGRWSAASPPSSTIMTLTHKHRGMATAHWWRYDWPLSAHIWAVNPLYSLPAKSVVVYFTSFFFVSVLKALHLTFIVIIITIRAPTNNSSL